MASMVSKRLHGSAGVLQEISGALQGVSGGLRVFLEFPNGFNGISLHSRCAPGVFRGVTGVFRVC